MRDMNTAKPIIAVVGPTASGKSALGILLALKFGGEIICADSRTIYKDMDKGTAKPSTAERTLVPHLGLDLVDPSEKFSAAQFQRYATHTIDDIQALGNIPIVVGGSGMYVDGLLYGFDFLAGPDTQDDLDAKTLPELQQLAAERDLLPSSEVLQNKRHLVGFIRRGGNTGTRTELPKNILILGIRVEKAELDVRIEQRADSIIAAGLVSETQNLLEKWGPDAPALLAPAYKPFVEYSQGKLSLPEARERFILNDKQLAKRQMTWYKRNKDVHWVTGQEQAEQLVADFLAKFVTIDP